MPNWINNAREFLGLGQDPYFEEYDDDPDDGFEVDHEPPVSRSRPARPAAPAGAEWEDNDNGVRVINSGAADTAPTVPAPGPIATGDRNVVRPLPTTSKPEIISPTRFEDVQHVADAFKRSQPVIANLQGVDRDLSRRLIDFASGLCYGLEGEMERVADQVFLLTPKGAAVSEDDRRLIESGQLGNDG